MLSVVVGVQGQIGFDSLESRDHAGQGAHMPAEARDGRRRRDAAVTAAGHHHSVARAWLDRRRRAARIAQFLMAAVWALRAGANVMLHDGRAE